MGGVAVEVSIRDEEVIADDGAQVELVLRTLTETSARSRTNSATVAATNQSHDRPVRPVSLSCRGRADCRGDRLSGGEHPDLGCGLPVVEQTATAPAWADTAIRRARSPERRRTWWVRSPRAVSVHPIIRRGENHGRTRVHALEHETVAARNALPNSTPYSVREVCPLSRICSDGEPIDTARRFLLRGTPRRPVGYTCRQRRRRTGRRADRRSPVTGEGPIRFSVLFP